MANFGMSNTGEINQRRVVYGGIAVILFLVVLVASFGMLVHLDARQIMVVQSAFTGKLTVQTQPGPYLRWFATVTKYPKRSQIWFSNRKDQGNDTDESLPIRFNDNGNAKMSVGISYEMPLDTEHVLLLHTKFGSQAAIEKQLVETVVQKAVYATGPLMSSQESSASHRNDLFQYLEDQIQNGVYRTETVPEKQKDVMTGQEKTVNIVHIVSGKDGLPIRTDDSPLKTFGIKAFNPVINSIVYDGKVEDQIQKQQEAIMQVQLAMAEAQKAVQRSITVGKEGEANAATAKWEQEVVKARAVTQAQQQLEVAELEAKAAEQTKRRDILLGEGEAEKRKLIMSADGALDKKLAASIEINKNYADAIKNYSGNWVPSVVMGGGNGQALPGSGAQALVEMLTAKTARDLGLDMSVPGSNRAKKQ